MDEILFLGNTEHARLWKSSGNPTWELGGGVGESECVRGRERERERERERRGRRDDHPQ
jgi:hypothetical protein